MADARKQKAHFVGIGGIGISALAQLFVHEGWDIVGTNDSESPETLDRIRDLGVPIYVGVDIKNVSPDTDLIVYSDAWLTRDPEFMAELEATGISMRSYFEALGTISEEKRVIAIAGTHGKTTTTAMLGKILRDGDMSPSAIVGSIVKDFGSNYLSGTSDFFVVEACEYRRHFLNFRPEVLVVTNLEFDHTDYFTDLADVQNAFRELMERVPAHGFIVTDVENPNIQPLLADLPATVIDYMTYPKYELRMLGEFNEMNARAAVAAARVVAPGLLESVIVESLQEFHGTWRRFEDKGITKSGAHVYDDYAHHPTAVKETLRAVRGRISKDGLLFVVFHPHLYSRTRDLLDGFARAFNDADEIIIAPIFAAREVDDGTVSNEILAERIRKEGGKARALNSFAEIEHALQKEAGKGDVIITMGAGDIYKVADALTV